MEGVLISELFTLARGTVEEKFLPTYYKSRILIIALLCLFIIYLGDEKFGNIVLNRETKLIRRKCDVLSLH